MADTKPQENPSRVDGQPDSTASVPQPSESLTPATVPLNQVNAGACPHCGACQHCGRGGHVPFYPYYPYYPQPYYPPYQPYISWSAVGDATTYTVPPATNVASGAVTIGSVWHG